MAGSWILGLYFLLFQIFKIHCEGKGQPNVTGSFRALGELAEQVEIFPGQPEKPVQVSFEENYDEQKNMSVFTIWELGQNETFVENFVTGKTFQYNINSDTPCKLVTKKDWIDIDAPPSLMGFESDKKIRFALKKLLTLNSSYVVDSSQDETYRGLPANMWVYEMKGKEGNYTSTITIYAYWSNTTWTTTSGKKSTPLGYKITKIVSKTPPETHTQNINVFAFAQDSINKAAFEAREGLQCSEDFKSDFPFPSLPRMDAVSIHSEVAIPSYLEVKSIDTWYDMKNKLLRIDMDHIRNQEVGEEVKPIRRITSEYTSKELGATFSIDIYKGNFSCTVQKLDDYEFDAQDIINPKLDAKFWDMDHFFGVNDTAYKYIGKTIKRNIPCQLFQGRRTDWPEKSSGTETLWEWCLAVNLTADDDPVDFRDKELPIVSAKIYFIKSSDEDFPAGSQLIHHFYDAIAEDPNVIYSTAFDLSRCFSPSQRKQIQFTVDAEINSSNVHIFENATSDPSFLQLWRDQIYTAAKLSLSSLRITRVKSAIYNRIMYITFTLLDVHPQLPDKSKQKSLEDTQKDINATIDSGTVQIKYTYEKGKTLDLKAKPKTLVPQVDPTTMVHEEVTAEPPKTTQAVTEPTSTISTTKQVATPGNTRGTVAAVSVSMLIVGISLGAGGTFYKYRGLPMCCRRA